MSTKAPYDRDLLTAALAGFTAGYTTANTKVRFNTFGGMMTGNTVKVGIALYQQNWGWAGVYFACISLFAVGTVFALYMIQKLGPRAQRVFLLIFVAAFLLVDGLGVALKDVDEIWASLAPVWVGAVAQCPGWHASGAQSEAWPSGMSVCSWHFHPSTSPPRLSPRPRAASSPRVARDLCCTRPHPWRRLRSVRKICSRKSECCRPMWRPSI